MQKQRKTTATTDVPPKTTHPTATAKDKVWIFILPRKTGVSANRSTVEARSKNAARSELRNLVTCEYRRLARYANYDSEIRIQNAYTEIPSMRHISTRASLCVAPNFFSMR